MRLRGPFQLRVGINKKRNKRERTEALAKAQAGAVKRLEERLDAGARLGGDVPDTRAVEVHLDTVFARERGNGDDLILREDRPVQRVLKRDDLRRRAVISACLIHVSHEAASKSRTCERPIQ